ncbi:3-methyl-2-oxobutanoate hydroxymethyltransferase [Aquifex aeolicus]|uniref:3-methyl-2-oxobutanoate hydroxymethyltransferase n=1 Tax=Aquifex aeolicus (strain VF5) TaxID=224324 RepID=PANB_AQUAE|nr:3-methyl-2-oxobutanoate hydroxymethyltransferase [Aquifex aeolicus]O67783.1 RecName: Full=3-methyl-2-oxobutanoate hydroxymethyltransferase; AltName: Full=Ketopantoate hydroxymethyltransferase; Short=KPHMT [Aquifex aeolicus VF5]AAC07749.1 3-methyl-2-oxobutanoate hydroxymethyltransferase [Aquifex aeolicus VF5]
MAINLQTLFKKKREGKKITMVSTYDYWSAKLCDEVGIDCILVGDSLGTVVKGEGDTLSVTLEEIIYHTKCVMRGVKNAFVIADMPFMSYQVSMEKAVENCGRVIKETKAKAVKLEGGEEIAELVYKLTRIGIPVVGHVGFTPQHINVFGKPKVVGKKKEEEEKLRRDFRALEEAGAFMIVLESVPTHLAKELWKGSNSIVIGIGAGKYVDGQVLVFHDIVGLFEDFKPKFVRRYLEGAKLVKEALKNFKIDVEGGNFPSEEESYG